MKYKALVSFSGVISMATDEVREISNESVAKDLLKAGYIIEMKEYRNNPVQEVKPEEEKPIKKPSKKKGGK